MGFAALFFVRLQRGVLFPCLQLGLFPCLLPDGSSLQRPGLQRLPDGASLPADCLPCRSLLPCPLPTVFCSAPAGSPLCRRSPACNSFATAPLPATSLIGAPASNKPHPAEKSTPVWLAIWRTWAGFANSQHRDAALATPDNICAHSSLLQTLSSCSDRRKSVGPSAPIAYATSVSPPDEAVARPWAQVSDPG